MSPRENIPINFAFSYIFGVLAGCSNIVKLSSKQFPQIPLVCDVINDTLKEFPEIARRTAFIRYGHHDEITTEFSKNADARLIWGGDATIANIRKMESKPRCVDICFADRYSICVLNGKAILEASEDTLIRLVDGFYNDTYLMDQNACSSEQIIFWLNDSKEARQKFWNATCDFAKKKYHLQAAVSVDKYTQMFRDILDGNLVCSIQKNTNILYRVELSDLKGNITKLRGDSGYFYEYPLEEFSEIAPYVTDKFQTVTYFGINPEEIRNFVVEYCLRGIDRIVPIGSALDIDIVWDGFDLVKMLSRIVDVR